MDEIEFGERAGPADRMLAFKALADRYERDARLLLEPPRGSDWQVASTLLRVAAEIRRELPPEWRKGAA